MIVLRFAFLMMVCMYWMSKPPLLHLKAGQLDYVEENWGWRCTATIVQPKEVPLGRTIEIPEMFVVSNKAMLQKGVYGQINDKIVHVKCDVRPMPLWLSSMSNGLLILDGLSLVAPDPDFFSYVAVILIAYRLFHTTFVF